MTIGRTVWIVYKKTEKLQHAWNDTESRNKIRQKSKISRNTCIQTKEATSRKHVQQIYKS